LKEYQLLPFKRSAELIRTLYECSISEGTLANMINGVGDSVEVPLSEIVAILTKSEVAHFDESGASVKGTSHWFHTASTHDATLYAMHESRGRAAMDAMGVLPGFTGRAIHDHWKPYYTYTGCTHGACNAHHLRELIFVHEEVGQHWAKRMKKLLLKIKKTVDAARAAGRTALEEKVVARFKRRYREIVAKGMKVNPIPDAIPGKRGRVKDTKAGNLVRRLKQYQEETLAFMYDFSVPFDNNLAERYDRMLKVHQKISGTFRSTKGSENFCRIRSYLSTACKQNLSPFDALMMAVSGKPFMPIPKSKSGP
jgi:hypothetical protein